MITAGRLTAAGSLPPMRVAVLGDINIDVAVGVETMPGPGEEVFASSSRIGLGGSGLNTAVVLTHLGLTTTILAQVGADPFGSFALSELDAIGIDTSRLVTSPRHTTGLNLVTVTGDGERSMVGARGANPAYANGPPAVGDWLHLSGYSLLGGQQRDAARAALEWGKEHGVPISMDIPAGVGARIGPDLAQHLSGCRLVSGGLASLAAIAPATEPVAALLELGVERVAVTAGAGPCQLTITGTTVTVAPPTVESLDSTGAGDSFIAGLIAADLFGLDPGPALTVAAALGAAAVTHRGAGASLGDAARVEAVLERWDDRSASLEEASRFLDTRLSGGRRPSSEVGLAEPAE